MKVIASLAFMLVVALVLALTSATKALADDDEETPEQLQVRCIEEGGCAIISRRELMLFRNHMLEEGRKRGLEEGARLCRKGTT